MLTTTSLRHFSDITANFKYNNMKTNDLMGNIVYESPEVIYHEIQCEGVLCQSLGDGKTGGFDDFTFDEEDSF